MRLPRCSAGQLVVANESNLWARSRSVHTGGTVLIRIWSSELERVGQNPAKTIIGMFCKLQDEWWKSQERTRLNRLVSSAMIDVALWRMCTSVSNVVTTNATEELLLRNTTFRHPFRVASKASFSSERSQVISKLEHNDDNQFRVIPSDRDNCRSAMSWQRSSRSILNRTTHTPPNGVAYPPCLIS